MKFALLISALIGLVVAADDTKHSLVKFQVIKSIEQFRIQHPNVTVTELEVSRNARLNQNWYTLGRRQTNDRLVGANNGWAQYPSKDNLELRIWYPVNGSGAIVTFIQILINQDNGTYGRGYVVSGGIGQRNIQVVVEAWNTAYISYDYQIFGV